MTIPAELEAEILRYYYVEKWKVGTIAQQLSVHHGTVKRVLTTAGVPKKKVLSPGTMFEPYVAFVLDVLKKHPLLTASRLYAMVCERGYPGGADHFRHIIALYRPPIPAEAYLRLKTLPGEQAQVDWGHFGKVTIGKAQRPLMAFVMVLSYSRKIFLQFYFDARMASFLRGHIAAFNAFNGVPRVLLYDNLKSEVLERQGEAIRFNPILLDFSAHYRYEPRPVAVARGNEKGRVERSIRYIRDNFFAAREWKDINDLNAQAIAWCNGAAAIRRCPEDKAQTVKATFLTEQPKLLELPDNPYPNVEREQIKVGKTPYVRFDLNDYSVPHACVRQILTLEAEFDFLTILADNKIIATHRRCYDKGKQIEQIEHINKLVEYKSKAREHRGQNRLTNCVPVCQEFLIKAAARGYHLKSIIRTLQDMLDTYGAEELNLAIIEALEKEVPHTNTVRLSLEKRRIEKSLPPPLPIKLPNDNRVRELTIKPHKLNDYKQLQTTKETDNE